MADDKDSLERAKELLIYFPVGFAMYLRDHGPSFLKVFISRGRSEVQRGQQTVNQQVVQVRTVGENAVENNGAPVLQFVSDGLTTLRERVEEALNTLGSLTSTSTSSPGSTSGPAGSDPADVTDADVGPAATSTHWSAPPTSSAAGPVPDPVARPSSPGTLPIADYDRLSASQIVDRLSEFGRDDLEAVRAYETAHRARNTVLGKIEQLTRGS